MAMSLANFIHMYNSLEGAEMTQDMYLAYLEVKNLLEQSLSITTDEELAMCLIAMAGIIAKQVADKNG
jgi:hypothetical protein